MVDNAPSVGILRCYKNPVDPRDKNIQQRAESLSLAGASGYKKSTPLPPAAPSTCRKLLRCITDNTFDFDHLHKQGAPYEMPLKWQISITVAEAFLHCLTTVLHQKSSLPSFIVKIYRQVTLCDPLLE